VVRNGKGRAEWEVGLMEKRMEREGKGKRMGRGKGEERMGRGEGRDEEKRQQRSREEGMGKVG